MTSNTEKIVYIVIFALVLCSFGFIVLVAGRRPKRRDWLLAISAFVLLVAFMVMHSVYHVIPG